MKSEYIIGVGITVIEGVPIRPSIRVKMLVRNKVVPMVSTGIDLLIFLALRQLLYFHDVYQEVGKMVG